jgi:hypothetical protein
MNRYEVVFTYEIDIEADDTEEAEEYAYAFLTEKIIRGGLSPKDLQATVKKYR